MSAGRFGGLSVLVTGAAGGFGSLAARRFGKEGARLILSDLAEEPLQALAKDLRTDGIEVEALARDVSEPETAAVLVDQAVAAYGRLDVAVNNAGIAHPFAKLEAIEPAIFERMLAVNLTGVFLALRSQIPTMQRQFSLTGTGGVILNVASVAGVVGAPLLSAYAAAKHGVVGLTKSAAGECARKGVRINALCPAFAGTAMVEDALAQMPGERDESVERLVSNMPMRRLAKPEEVVEAMLFACAPDNGFMTGHALVLDGGLSAV